MQQHLEISELTCPYSIYDTNELMLERKMVSNEKYTMFTLVYFHRCMESFEFFCIKISGDSQKGKTVKSFIFKSIQNYSVNVIKSALGLVAP